MSTITFVCGCFISTSMFGEHEVMQVHACFEHSLDNRVHEAQKQLFAVAGSECPENFQDPDVQDALVALAGALGDALFK